MHNNNRAGLASHPGMSLKAIYKFVYWAANIHLNMI